MVCDERSEIVLEQDQAQIGVCQLQTPSSSQHKQSADVLCGVYLVDLDTELLKALFKLFYRDDTSSINISRFENSVDLPSQNRSKARRRRKKYVTLEAWLRTLFCTMRWTCAV